MNCSSGRAKGYDLRKHVTGRRFRLSEDGMIQVDIFSDPICPWCFIGKRRFEQALAARPDVAVEMHWRAFQLNPSMPPEGMDRQTYLTVKFGNAAHAAQLYDNIRRVGEAAGIAFAFDRIQRTPNTLNAHRLIRYAARSGVEDNVVERLFVAYFLEGRDIGDRKVLADIADEAGLDRGEVNRFLAGEDELDAVRAEDFRARQLGIQGVPCFLLAERYAVSGAQEPEAFFPLFDMLVTENKTPDTANDDG